MRHRCFVQFARAAHVKRFILGLRDRLLQKIPILLQVHPSISRRPNRGVGRGNLLNVAEKGPRRGHVDKRQVWNQRLRVHRGADLWMLQQSLDLRSESDALGTGMVVKHPHAEIIARQD